MSSKGPISIKLKRSLKFDQLMARANAPQRLKGYNIGWPSDSHYNKGHGKTITTSAVAKINEFGAPNSAEKIGQPNNSGIPERPFFRAANDKFHHFIRAYISYAVRAGQKLGYKETHFIGKRHVKFVKDSILYGKWEPNADVTIARKTKRLEDSGNDDAEDFGTQPLIETGKLYKDVNYATVR